MICTTNDGSTDDPGTIVTIGESGLYTFIVKKTSDEITATNTRKHPRQEGDRLSRVLSFFIIRRITPAVTGHEQKTLISFAAFLSAPVHGIVRWHYLSSSNCRTAVSNVASESLPVMTLATFPS